MKRKIVFALGIISTLMITAIPGFAHTEGDPFITDLMAGQHMDAGDVLVWNDGDTLYVKYVTTSDWCLTETHLDVEIALEDIPQTQPNKKGQGGGNPIPGHFEYNDEHDCVTEFLYTIELTWLPDTELYIAAHAVVCQLVGYEGDLNGLEANLPETVDLIHTHPGSCSYFITNIFNSGNPDFDGLYEGFCVDTDHTTSPGTTYTADVYSSYDTELPVEAVKYRENLDLVNYILNQDYCGQLSACGGTYTLGDIQRAIWALIENEQSTSGLGPWSQCRVTEILADAQANGEGFTPDECGDDLAVILMPLPLEIAQYTLIKVPVPCIPVYECETAWGAGSEFPGDNWAMYFEYEVQEVQ